eukprot:CAMPEP_0178624134 /NCGR_PEP_ID=MMETSP0698-20121128/7196_1 /TAXON_ID=265572 /ORGANISM="Extubocellulus spinifer, Strain CCMP396" /LENGTH=258 /DNA_ID=CAMNT_0020263237 /DNA_START=36 /DNA_END=812 /DNA_ORIENTATION=-
MRLHSFSASLALLLARDVSSVSSFVVSFPSSIAYLRSSTSIAPSGAMQLTSSSTRRIRMANAGEEHSSSTFPTIEQAAKDGFLQQLSHASEICSLLEQPSPESDSMAADLLKAQLSHSDGVRGFFATYLTGQGNTAADEKDIPTPLANAMGEADMDVLVPLACMNVVMPTAMISMHTDPELSANAAKTAERGMRVLKWLEDKDESVKTNCQAILSVATGDNLDGCDGERVEFWKKFFSSYGYEDKQTKGIAEAIQKAL